MTITVLFFAQARDRAGCASQTLCLPDGSGVADALEAIERQHPSLAALWPHLAVAVDGLLADRGMTLRPGAELALLPPVSGGCASRVGQARRSARASRAPRRRD